MKKSANHPKVGDVMEPIELSRTSMLDGFKTRLVKYRDAPEVVLMPVKKDKKAVGPLQHNKCIEGAIEIIIPKKYNDMKMVKMLEKEFKKFFARITDAKWFKADKDTSFEKTGDNVLELYGYLTKSFVDKYVKEAPAQA